MRRPVFAMQLSQRKPRFQIRLVSPLPTTERSTLRTQARVIAFERSLLTEASQHSRAAAKGSLTALGRKRLSTRHLHSRSTQQAIHVADTGNNRIRKVTPEGAVSTIAGDGTAGYADGPAAQSRFNGPIGVAVDKDGNVYVADTYNDRVRKISTDNQVTTVAGAGTPGYADGVTTMRCSTLPAASP